MLWVVLFVVAWLLVLILVPVACFNFPGRPPASQQTRPLAVGDPLEPDYKGACTADALEKVPVELLPE